MSIIDIDQALKLKDSLIIDVRSQKEYEIDHIPGSINLPVLNNEEHHIVGYVYKQIDEKKALDLGHEIFHKKINDFENIVEKNKGKNIIFYCARGGMRSSVFVKHFNAQGINVSKIDRGYKSYREYVREQLDSIKLPKKIIVLYGLTGVSKTELIKRLKNSIDLEELAKHRSSVFGSVGLNPVSQKMFESNLLQLLQKKYDYIIFEGESRKIGNVMIPKAVFDAMNNGHGVNVYASLETRAKRIVADYFDNPDKIAEIIRILPRLSKIIGTKKVNEYIQLILTKKYYEFSLDILKNYYDPKYEHAIKDMVYELEVSSEDIDKAVRIIEDYCNGLK